MIGQSRYRSALALALCAALVLGGCARNSVSSVGAGAYEDETVAALMRAADEKREAGDYRAAATLYRSAHEADPTERAAPLIGLGRSLAAAGAPQDAAEAYRAALRIESDAPDALRGLGNALVTLGQPSLALPYFERARAAAPDDWRTELGQGAANDLLGRHETAQRFYRAGLDKQPDQPDLISNLGLSLALTGDFSAATAAMERLLDSPQATARHRQTLALVYGLAGRPEAARRVAALDLPPDTVERNLAFYERLRRLEDPAQRLRAIRARTVD